MLIVGAEMQVVPVLFMFFSLPLIAKAQKSECYNYKKPIAFPEDAFVRDGDVLIGVLYSVRDKSSNQSNPCGGSVVNWRLQQNIQAIVYSIERINMNSSLLPNVTLGFAMVDDCRNAITALGQAMIFTQGSDEKGAQCRDEDSGYQVAAVLGPTSSSRSIPSSQLLGLYHIPQISPEATSDDLTNHFDHAYFMRMVPPDKNQGSAIVDLIVRFNWTYVSLLYSAGSYGSNLAKQVQNRARENAICIGSIHEFEDNYQDEDRMERTIDKLVENRQSARVLILIMTVDHLREFFRTLVMKDAVGQFVMIGGDTLDQRSFVDYPEAGVGVMSLAFPLDVDREFETYFGNLNPDTTGGNPWFESLWTNLFGCSWKDDPQCRDYDKISIVDNYYISSWTSKTQDAVSVVAKAIEQIIKKDCPDAVGNRVKLRQCVQGTKLLRYLKDVSFDGLSGPIAFDENGELIGNYLVNQFVIEEGEQVWKTVAIWQRDTLGKSGNLTFLQEPKFYLAGELGGEIEDAWEAPESVCSHPCEVGYIYVQKELPCCWECLQCRENEYVTSNGTSCQACPLLFWPEEFTRESCERINPTYLAITDPFGMTLAILAIFGLILTIVWTYILIRHSHRKVIKASSVPVTGVIAAGFYVSFISAFIFVLEPSVVSCSIGHVGFHLSCTLLYGPLSVKTVRIYRIFAASKKCRRPRHLVSLNSQMVTIGVLMVIQVLLVIITFLIANWEKYSDGGSMLVLLAPSSPRLEMPVVIQEYTELYCERHQIALYPPLAFNLLLLVVCDVTAFLTRRLPEAFNESWFIFLSVSSTLVIWMAFLPTYFILFFAFFKESLLSLALLLNAFCNIVFTCAPKIYAVWWVEDEDIAATYDINDTMEKDRRRMTKRMNASASDVSDASKTTAISGNDTTNKKQPQ